MYRAVMRHQLLASSIGYSEDCVERAESSRSVAVSGILLPRLLRVSLKRSSRLPVAKFCEDAR